MPIRLSIKRHSTEPTNVLSAHLANAFDRALALDSKLSKAATFMQGMSGKHYRYFINNLVGSMEADARYLEIGSWRGSTACSVMDGNTVRVRCIDNWSEFGGPKDEFHANTRKFLSPNVDFDFIESDFRKVDFESLGKFNIYLFDGPHERQDQYDGVAMAMPALENEFVFIVDDWNFDRVRQGTFDALGDQQLEVVSSIEVRTTQDNTMCQCMCEISDWHNGYFLAVLRK